MSMKALPLILVLALAACGGSEEAKQDDSKVTDSKVTEPKVQEPEVQEPESTSPGVHPIDARYAATPPEGAIEVSQLRSRADGDQVVVRADVMDYAPVNGMAILKVIDHSLLSCDEMGDDDHCATPWDFCCVDEAEIALASALIEFRDEGKLVAASFKDFHGIDYLSDVVVSGILRIDAQQNISIVADSIHVE